MPSGVEVYLEFRLMHGSGERHHNGCSPHYNWRALVRVTKAEWRKRAYSGFVRYSRVRFVRCCNCTNEEAETGCEVAALEFASTSANFDDRMRGRKRACRIGCAGILCKQEKPGSGIRQSLRCAVASAARFRHPLLATKALERR